MPLLTINIFLPLLGTILIAVIQSGTAAKWMAMATSGFSLLASVWLAARFDSAHGGFQFEEKISWIPSLGASYHLGIDGISLPLILLTTALTFLSVVFSKDEPRASRPFFALFLVWRAGLLAYLARLIFCFFTFSSKCL